MRPILILIFLIFFVFVAITDGRGDRQLSITSLSIKFDKADATFIIDYQFDKLTNLYFFMFGTQNIVPKIEDLFFDFDYKIVKVDNKEAILMVKNISRLNNGYYLHDSRKLGDTIDTVYISDSSSTEIKEYHDINATPYHFYKS